MAAPTGDDGAVATAIDAVTPPLSARLGLWRLTRHPAVRSTYDWLADRGLVFAQLDRFELTEAALGTVGPSIDDLPEPPAGLTVAARRADEGLPARLEGAPVAPEDQIVEATRDGEPVGHCCLSARRIYVPELDRRLRPPGHYCWRLYVSPEARGEGVGRAIVAEGVRWAASSTVASQDVSAVDVATPRNDNSGNSDILVSALVAPDNLPSRRVFAALGFRPTVRHTAVGVPGRTWHRTRRLG